MHETVNWTEVVLLLLISGTTLWFAITLRGRVQKLEASVTKIGTSLNTKINIASPIEVVDIRIGKTRELKGPDA